MTVGDMIRQESPRPVKISVVLTRDEWITVSNALVIGAGRSARDAQDPKVSPTVRNNRRAYAERLTDLYRKIDKSVE